jgi:hypothetical protein
VVTPDQVDQAIFAARVASDGIGVIYGKYMEHMVIYGKNMGNIW